MRPKVITVTPAGRRSYIEILVPYLLANRAHIDEHHFWVNTKSGGDIAYLQSLAQQHPDFFKLKRRPVHDRWRPCDSIWHYFQDYVEDETVYIRFDDDICYIAPEAIPRLVACRVAEREPFLIFGNIVNNSICSYIQQRRGLLPRSWGKVKKICKDRVGWARGRFAARVHRLFLEDIRSGNVARWEFPRELLPDYDRFSINVICWFGHDLKGLPELSIPNLYTENVTHPLTGEEIDDEESTLTEYFPAKFARPCLICGDAVFGHFAYFTQRPYLEFFTNILDDYYNVVHPARALAESEVRSESLANWWRVLSRRNLRHEMWRAAFPKIADWRDKMLKQREQRQNAAATTNAAPPVVSSQ